MESEEARDEQDPFEGVVFDDDFVRGGAHEPPARTREAIVRYRGKQTSWRYPIAPGARPLRGRQHKGAVRRVLEVSWIFASLLALFAAAGWISWVDGSRISVFAFVVSGWLLSLCLHEFSHALVAYWGGDRSVEVKGYLTLDIRRYGHPVYTFLLPALFVLLGGIGLPGGAVWIEQASLRSRRWRTLTSLAGPAANLVCAVACLVPFLIVSPVRFMYGPRLSFWAGLAFLSLLQLWAVMLNLLPIPGLDGWGAVEPYLPSHIVQAGRRISPFAIMVLFFVVVSSPTVSAHLANVLESAEALFRVPRGLAGWGNHLMRFWSLN